MDENVKQVENYHHHEQQKYENDDPIEYVLHNAIME